jgi:hypothetical protein
MREMAGLRADLHAQPRRERSRGRDCGVYGEGVRGEPRAHLISRTRPLIRNSSGNRVCNPGYPAANGRRAACEGQFDGNLGKVGEGGDLGDVLPPLPQHGHLATRDLYRLGSDPRHRSHDLAGSGAKSVLDGAGREGHARGGSESRSGGGAGGGEGAYIGRGGNLGRILTLG